MNANTNKNTLYQVHVVDTDKMEIPIGPAVSESRMLEPLVEAINLAVAAGQEKRWHDARIVTVDRFVN